MRKRERERERERDSMSQKKTMSRWGKQQRWSDECAKRAKAREGSCSKEAPIVGLVVPSI